MRRSVVEGACYALMVGLGDLYIVANGIRLGAGTLAVGLMVALPLSMGAFGSWFALQLMRKGRSRRKIAVIGASGQVIAYAAMAGFQAMGILTPRLLIALAVFHQMSGQAAGVVWASWFGDLVPEAQRGKYFSKRNRVVHSATCVAAITGGLTLQFVEPANAGAQTIGQGGMGFIILCSAAAAARGLSMLLLATTSEPEALVPDPAPQRIYEVIRENETARRVLLVTLGMMLSVWIAAPYFAAFMLEDLRFSYVEYTIANVSMVIATVLVLPWWGKAIDLHGPRGPYITAIIGIALVPIPWFFAGGLAWVVPAQLLSGIAWGGHELSQFTSILGGVPPRERARVFAAVNAVSGFAQLTGALIGGALIGLGGFRVLLAVTIATRLGVAVLAAASLPTKMVPKRVLLRLIGVRWAGGLRHRHIPAPQPPPAPPKASTPGLREGSQ